MFPAWFIPLGGILAAVAVGLGALAHALKEVFDARQLETFQTAVHYQMIHAVGLILIGILSLSHRSVFLSVAGISMIVGIAIFSGCLYAWLATGFKPLVYPVPIGGVAFMVGWVSLAIGAWGLVAK